MNFKEFITKVSHKIDIDLTSYKEKRVKRRSKNLINKHGIDNYQVCLDKLTNSTEFQREFLEYMTINTSEFFRNPDNFKYLQKEIMPQLFKTTKKVKIWSAAASNGCEAYTLAIILNELQIDPSRYQIKATDIDPSILEEARAGKYKKNSIKKVAPQLVDKYFTKEKNYYQLDSKIMNQVKFDNLNLLTDKYDSNLDLILCRNVFIYFTKEIKEQLTTKLSNSLTKDGILFLGNTEYLLQPEKFNFKKIYTSFYKKC
ncbi:protein-glutamate O-methyltransferase CheR [Natroniella acetigena]|uniref:CheR family methyltransferase n=1 Tax=Natroniella acetigena TaxID=52004 RepID=UPI00200A883A|nr:protein-glutamate O-methyltransferase CheR [Natroniella acetigena]MCK8828312.1 protein-glutamate O-methyltransferase CheR [Natroniella acetigena]